MECIERRGRTDSPGPDGRAGPKIRSGPGVSSKRAAPAPGLSAPSRPPIILRMRRRAGSGSRAVLALALGLACARDPAQGAREVTREEFIETYTALLRAEAQAADSVEARLRKAWVLERRGLDATDVERFTQRHADDPEEMAEIWKEIESRMRALQSDTTKTDEDAPPD